MVNLESIFYKETQPAIKRVPFCQKNLKEIRLRTEGVFHLYASLFYQMAAKITNNPFYHGAVHYHRIRFIKFFSYKAWRNQLIDFSINHPNRPLEESPQNANQIEFLKKTYGAPVIETLLQWKPISSCGIDWNAIKPLKNISGCCIGMSAQFIACYLKALKAGTTPDHAVEQIAPLFSNGASNAAQLAQILHEARDLKELHQITDKWQVEIRKLLNPLSLSFPTLIIFLFQLLWLGREIAVKKLEEKLEKFKDKCEEKLVSMSLSIQEVALQIMGLTATQEKNCDLKNSVSFEKFEAFLHALPPGAYQTHLSSNQGEAHSIVCIKTAGENHFLFDPNYGTIAVDRTTFAKDFWKLIKLDNFNRLRFRLCQL